MRIGELARRIGCRVQTIRYYEHAGLLSAPDRSEGNFRLYGDADAERLSFIRNCRALDMTLDEIRALLRFRDVGGDDCAEVDALLDEHFEHVQRRIAELQALAGQLGSLRARCGRRREIAACGILRGLAETQGGNAAQFTDGHVAGTHSQLG